MWLVTRKMCLCIFSSSLDLKQHCQLVSAIYTVYRTLPLGVRLRSPLNTIVGCWMRSEVFFSSSKPEAVFQWKQVEFPLSTNGALPSQQSLRKGCVGSVMALAWSCWKRTSSGSWILALLHQLKLRVARLNGNKWADHSYLVKRTHWEATSATSDWR